MATPQDQQRIRAFQAFVQARANADAVRLQLGISPRSWERMRAGRKPPPVRLFPRLALVAWDDGQHAIARALWDVGMPPSVRTELEQDGIPSTFDDAMASRLRRHLAKEAAAECAAIATLAGGNHA
jgi:hypothetical protein